MLFVRKEWRKAAIVGLGGVGKSLQPAGAGIPQLCDCHTRSGRDAKLWVRCRKGPVRQFLNQVGASKFHERYHNTSLAKCGYTESHT